MRLRYLHIRNYPPLEDVALCFNPPGLQDRECAIRFVVGVNGSGKTRLLQGIADTFLALARQQKPRFPVTLAWELGENDRRRTLVFDNPGQGLDIGWWQSDTIAPDGMRPVQWERLLSEIPQQPDVWKPLIRDGNWPGKEVGLPQVVLTYTTGSTDPWLNIFRHEPAAVDVDRASQSMEYDGGNERPAGWSRRQEIDYQASQAGEESRAELLRLKEQTEQQATKEQEQETCLLLDLTLLKFALLAVSLPQAMMDFRQYQTDETIQTFIKEICENPDDGTGLRRLLSQTGWVWPVSVVLQIDFNPDAWGGIEKQVKSNWLHNLYLMANEAVREPEPSTQRRLFFDVMSKLPENRDNEFIGDDLLEFLGGPESSPYDAFKLLLELHRQGLLTDIQIAIRKADIEDILMFDELSDGEQVYLGRMALFHLLEGEDDALVLLDEPEVHFNDKWKREIVDIIDDVLKDRFNDVLIATHSSITLTDVFNDEIILFEKQDGQAKPIEIRSTTFGADPSEVMVRLFGVPDSIGERALEWLDAQLDRKWTSDDIPELEKLLKRIGPGYHRSELRGILRKLQTNAPQD